MGSLIFAVLRSNWKLIAIILVVGGVVADIALLNHQLSKKEQMLNTANNHIEILTAEFKTSSAALKKSIDLQNEAIGQYKEEADKAQDLLDASVKKAAKDKAANEARIFGILNGVKPTTCQGSIDSLVDAAKTLQWND